MACADDVDIISRSEKSLEEVCTCFEEMARTVGLITNTSKTKYMVTSGHAKQQETARKVRINGQTFERVDRFKYLGSVITEKNETSEDVCVRILIE